ncbi:MAG: hypothetical protein U9N52_05655 [Campylobacterota bacterium]|nr:hypothetical protein [Campylobacterota bacterium]
MKKVALVTIALAMTLFANEGGFEKSGFLTTQACADQGAFTDCYLENYFCGSDGCFLTSESGVNENTPLVLYSHDDGITYKLTSSSTLRHDMDHGINRNAVTVVGEFDASTNTIAVQEFKAPPPPKKSFFKGCL